MRRDLPIALTLDERCIITTESTAWLFDGGGRYQRLPLGECGPRLGPYCNDQSLDDGAWIAYREAWLEDHPHAPGRCRLRVVPSHRFEGSLGVWSGVITGCTSGAAAQLIGVEFHHDHVAGEPPAPTSTLS